MKSRGLTRSHSAEKTKKKRGIAIQNNKERELSKARGKIYSKKDKGGTSEFSYDLVTQLRPKGAEEKSVDLEKRELDEKKGRSPAN